MKRIGNNLALSTGSGGSFSVDRDEEIEAMVNLLFSFNYSPAGLFLCLGTRREEKRGMYFSLEVNDDLCSRGIEIIRVSSL